MFHASLLYAAMVGNIRDKGRIGETERRKKAQKETERDRNTERDRERSRETER